MAQFSPQPVRSRRRRMVAAQRTCCGIALASFRLNAECSASEEMLLLPVSAFFVENVLKFNTFCNLSEADKRFVNRLACHQDARLRTGAAAVEEALDLETVSKLAKDPAFAVRQELSQNDDAIGKLTAMECVQLTQNDTSLIVNLLRTLEHNVHESARTLDNEDLNSLGDVPNEKITAIEKLRLVVGAFKTHFDRVVRNEVADAEEELKEADNDPKSFAPTEVVRAHKRWKERSLRESFVGNHGDYAIGFVFLDETALSEGNVTLDAGSPVLRLPLDAYDDVIRDLPNGEQRDVFLKRFAANTNADVREAMAGIECIPKAVLDFLKTDDNYDVRLALLQNESALTELSEKEIIALIRGDASLVREAFEYADVGARMRSILETAFEDSDDPGIWELLEAVGE